MYKYKKLQTLINYIVTKHGNTPQGASKITVSLLVQEVTQRAGKGRCCWRRPERLSPYKKQVVVIPKAIYKLHSRKRMPREMHQHGTAGGNAPSAPRPPPHTVPDPSPPSPLWAGCALTSRRAQRYGARRALTFCGLVALSTLRKDIYIKKYL